MANSKKNIRKNNKQWTQNLSRILSTITVDVSSPAMSKYQTLFEDLIGASREYDARVKARTGTAEEGQAGERTTEVVVEIQKLAREFDNLATIYRYREAIEEVSKGFEKAVDDIQRVDLADTIRSQIRQSLGAEAGLTEARFPRPLLRSELSTEQRVQQSFPGLVRFGNQLIASQKASAEAAVGFGEAERNIRIFFSELTGSRAAGGTVSAQTSQLQERTLAGIKGGLKEGEALTAAYFDKQLDVEERQLEVLTRMADGLSNSPRELGAELARASTRAAGAGDEVPGV